MDSSKKLEIMQLLALVELEIEELNVENYADLNWLGYLISRFEQTVNNKIQKGVA